MDNTLNNSTIQPMDADSAAASLAFATRLSEELMPKAPESPQNAPGEEKTEEISQSVQPDISNQLEAFKLDMKKELKAELSTLRQELLEALEDE